MHNILRSFVTSTILIEEATDDQIDKRGARKLLGSVWGELPTYDRNVIELAEQLLDDPTLAAAEPLGAEREWLKAVIDEVGSSSSDPPLSDEQSWASLVRNVASLGFCLHQAAGYAKDASYGKAGFQKIRDILSEADEFEKTMAFATITEAATQLQASDSTQAKQIVKAYDELLEVLHG